MYICKFICINVNRNIKIHRVVPIFVLQMERCNFIYTLRLASEDMVKVTLTTIDKPTVLTKGRAWKGNQGKGQKRHFDGYVFSHICSMVFSDGLGT